MRDSKDSWVKWGIYVTQILIFIWRTDAEAEAPKPWPPDVKSRLIRKDPNAGKIWKQEEKLVAEEETVAWHHRLSGHVFEQTLGDSEREVWHAAVHGVAESDMTLQWNNNNNKSWGGLSWTPLLDMNRLSPK